MSEKSKRQIQAWVDQNDQTSLRQLAIAMTTCKTVASAIRVVLTFQQQQA
jgi:hypothetical protein